VTSVCSGAFRWTTGCLALEFRGEAAHINVASVYTQTLKDTMDMIQNSREQSKERGKERTTKTGRTPDSSHGKDKQACKQPKVGTTRGQG
jgi:hypothetical protein